MPDEPLIPKKEEDSAMRKIVTLSLSLCMLMGTAALGQALPQEDTGIFPQIAGEEGTTYVNLFEVIVNDEWTPLWNDYIGAIVGEENAADTTAGLQGSVTSDLYGPEAARKARCRI